MDIMRLLDKIELEIKGTESQIKERIWELERMTNQAFTRLETTIEILRDDLKHLESEEIEAHAKAMDHLHVEQDKGVA